MRKIVKGKIEKYYCDVCGKNVCDYIPTHSSLKVAGVTIPEYGIKKHCEYRQIRRITKQGDYCLECYEREVTI